MCEAFFELFKDEVAAKIAAAELETEERVRTEIEERVRTEIEERVRTETEARMKALERENAELKKKLAIKLGKTKWPN